MAEQRVRETTGKNYLVPVRCIVANHNPRNPLSEELIRDGYSVFEANHEKKLPSLWSLATSEKAGDRAMYAHLIEERDPEIAALATTMLSVGQLEPVEVRDNGKKGSSGENTYTLIFGCRRVLACLYNWCVLGKPKEPVIEARLSPKLNEVGLLHRSVIENIRKDPTVLEIARSLQMALNNNETIDDLAKQYGRSTSWVRNKLALLQLPPEVQRRLSDGSLKESKALKLLKGDEEPSNGEVQQRAGGGSRPKIRSRKEIEEIREDVQLGNWTAIELLEWILRTNEKEESQ